MKIAIKMVLAVTITVTAVMIPLAWIGVSILETELVSRNSYRLNQALNFVDAQLKESEDQVIRTCELISQDNGIAKALLLDSAVGINQILNRIQHVYPFFNYVMVLAMDRDIFAVNTRDKNDDPIASEEMLGLSISKSHIFTKSNSVNHPVADVPAPDPFFSVLELPERISQWFASPVLKGSEQIGWIVLSYDWQSQVSLLLSRLQTQLISMGIDVVDISLQDTNGTTLSDLQNSTALKIAPSNKIQQEKTLSFGADEMKLIITLDKSGTYDRIRNFAVFYGASTFLASILLLGMLLTLLNVTILRPVRTLQKGANALEKGDLSYRIADIGDDELGALAFNFNKMAESVEAASSNLESKVEERTSQLRASRERMLRLFERHHTVMLLIEPDSGRIVNANSAAERYYGYTREQLRSMLISDINTLDLEQIKFQRKLALTEERNSFVFPHRLASGEIRTVEAHSSPIDTEGSTLLFSIIHDITERAQAEEKLKENNSFMEQLFENLPDMIFVKDATNLQFVRLNKAAEAILGYPRQDMLGKGDYDFFPKDQADFFVTNDREILTSGQLKQIPEEEIQTKDGMKILDTKKIPIVSSEGVPLFLLGISRDVTIRKQMEESLKKSAEKLRIVADYAYDWEYWIAPDGSLIYVSPSCERITEYRQEEFLENPALIQNIVFDEDRQTVFDHVKNSRSDDDAWLQFRIVTRSGKMRWVSHYCRPVFGDDGRWLGRRASNHDITYEKEMASELLAFETKSLHTAKLESLAVMAGGVAHDFNNQLMIVLGNLDILSTHVKFDDKATDKIQRSIEAVIKCAGYSNQLLAYTGQKYFDSEPVHLTKIVDGAVEGLRPMISSSISIDVQHSPDLPVISGDRDQLRCILINLVKNSHESIGESEGHIEIRTGTIDCDEAYLSKSKLHQKPEPGRFVFCEISDSGCGMDASTQSRMFDPFFSSKFWGRGLGLAEVSGTVKSHGGAILVESEPNCGTMVRVLFPVHLEHKSLSSSSNNVIHSYQATHSETLHAKTILLVEDEENVRHLCFELLQLLGFNVAVASDGIEGLEIFQENPEGIDLILLDILMPRMNGIEAFKEFVRIRPDIKIIISSGFTKDSLKEQMMGATPAGFLNKPYDLETLREELARVLVDP